MKTIDDYPVKYTCMPRIVYKQDGDNVVEEVDFWVPVTCLVLFEKEGDFFSLYKIIYLRDQNNLNKKDIDFNSNNLDIKLVNMVSTDYEKIRFKCEKLNAAIYANKLTGVNLRENFIRIQNKLFKKCYEPIEDLKVMKK